MVIVPEGQSVVLDIDTPILKMLNVNGAYKVYYSIPKDIEYDNALLKH